MNFKGFNKISCCVGAGKYIREIRANTNWNWGMAAEHLCLAKECGVSNEEYVKYRGWELDQAKLKKLGTKCERIREVCCVTGWDWDTAECSLDAAKQMGVPNRRYTHYKCWELGEEELSALGKKCKHIKAIRKAANWDWETAENKLNDAKVLGIPNFKYMYYECWKLDEEQLEQLGNLCKHIKRVRRETDCDWAEAELRLQNAAKLGLPYAQYVKHRGWELSEEEIEALGRNIQAVQGNESHSAGENRVTVEELDEQQKARLEMGIKLGIPEGEFLRKSLWLLSDEELGEFAAVVKARKEEGQKNHDFYVSVVCQKTGWDPSTADKALREAEKKGISELRYIQKEVWTKTADEVAFLTRYLKTDKKRVASNKNKYISMICDVTGWNVAKAELEVAKAKLNSGASYEDYFVFKMYDLTPEQQREYVTYGQFSKMRMKYNSLVPARKYFDDKAMFNKTFSDCIRRKWFVNRELSYEDFLQHIDGLDAVLVKLLTATQGIGVQKFSCKVEDKKALYDEIMALPTSIVEEYIVQHPAVMAFCDTSVNTLRITTLNANGKCNFLYAVFRMGQGKVVDNFHAGGIAATVDTETGEVVTHAADLDANVYPINPYSGMAMKGFKLPHWDQIIETCQRIYDRVPDVNLIGWDFAITPDGVDLIEGNPGASYVVAQIPRVEERIGLRREMVDPYL